MRKLAVERTDDGKISLTIGRSNPVIDQDELDELNILLISYGCIREEGVTGISLEDGKFSLSGPPEVVHNLMQQIIGDGSYEMTIAEEPGIPAGGVGDPNAPPMPPPNKPSEKKK